MAPEGPFRGKDDGIKPQGARFRVFQVDIDANENETVRREVTGAPRRPDRVDRPARQQKGGGPADLWPDGSGTLTRNTAAKFRNAGFDRDKLVIAAAASIKNAAGAAAMRNDRCDCLREGQESAPPGR